MFNQLFFIFIEKKYNTITKKTLKVSKDTGVPKIIQSSNPINNLDGNIFI